MKSTIDTFKTFDEANNCMIEMRGREIMNKEDFCSCHDEDEIQMYFDKEYTIESENNEFKVVEFDS